jgi:hypothetical protein
MKYSSNFDDQLKEIGHYKIYNEALPFVGIDYDKVCPKILIVAESHYVPHNWDYKLMSDDFYEDRKKYDDNNFDYGNINPRAVITKPKTHRIYSILNKVLPYGLNGASFVNFFHKPAFHKISINPTPKDIEVANYLFREVIKTILPDIVIFTSKKAYSHLKRTELDKGFIFSTPHPVSHSWNKKNKKYAGKSGKEIFATIIQNHINE